MAPVEPETVASMLQDVPHVVRVDVLGPVMMTGTTATILLPVSTEPDTQLAFERTNVDSVAGRTETILLVDDEPLVRAATAGMLQDAGFTVFEAESGAKAIDLVSQGIKFDALVTDYAMPGISGVKLANWLRERAPELPVLLITGYASVEDIEAGGLPRLAKPFRQQELAARLADLLDRPQAQ